MFQPESYRTAKLALCAAVLIITLFFGFKPKGFRFHNQVQWFQDKNGISFQNIGMAYSQKTLGEIGISDAISVVAELKPYRTGRQLSKIISIIDSGGQELMAIEQWEKGLMLALWDAAGRRIGKIGIADALSKDSMRLTAVTINHSEMKLFVERTPKPWRSKRIPLPSRLFSGERLLVGLGANGRNPWHGEIGRLALFKSAITEQDILTCAKAWGNKDNPPSALFPFDERGGKNIADRSGNRWDLYIPFYPKFFKHDVLGILPDFNKIDHGLLIDILVNFLGFIPLGGCLYIAFLPFRCSRRNTILLAIAGAVAVSFGIELLQAFIPTRSSQLIDVVFNGAGAWMGVRIVSLIFSSALMQEQGHSWGK